MKTSKALLLLLGSVVILSATCRKDSDDCHHNVHVVNKSSRPVYAIFSASYPDTSIHDPNPALSPEGYKVGVNEQKSIFSNRDCVEDYFKYIIHSDTLILFVFDENVLETNSWETVKQNNLVLKRYYLNLSELRSRNFTIEFP